MEASVYDSPDIIKGAFEFLGKDHSFEILEEAKGALGFYIVYGSRDRKLAMSFDYRDNFFTVALVKEGNTPYPNDADAENIIYIPDLTKHFPNENAADFQPTKDDYVKALYKNVDFLKTYASDILSGSEWLK